MSSGSLSEFGSMRVGSVASEPESRNRPRLFGWAACPALLLRGDGLGGLINGIGHDLRLGHEQCVTC